MIKDIIDWVPIVIAGMIIGNSILAGLYAMFAKLLDSSKEYTGNVYLVAAAKISKTVLKILDIIGFHPVRTELKKQIKENTKAIEEMKNGL